MASPDRWFGGGECRSPLFEQSRVAPEVPDSCGSLDEFRCARNSGARLAFRERIADEIADQENDNGIRAAESGIRAGPADPDKYTLDGENLSPPLEWLDPPPGTRSFALVMEDPDAPTGTFRRGLHNIMADRRLLPEGVGHGVKTEDLGLGINDFGNLRYDGRKPPKDHGTHHHRFRLIALDVEQVEDIWNGPRSTDAPSGRVRAVVPSQLQCRGRLG